MTQFSHHRNIKFSIDFRFSPFSMCNSAHTMGSTASVGGKSFLPRGLLRKVSSEPITEPIDERFRSTLERALLTVSLCLQSCNGAEPTRRVIIRSIFLVLFFTLFSDIENENAKCKKKTVTDQAWVENEVRAIFKLSRRKVKLIFFLVFEKKRLNS